MRKGEGKKEGEGGEGGKASVPPFSNPKYATGAPSISRERLKLETSNLAYRLATGGPNEKNAKLAQKGT